MNATTEITLADLFAVNGQSDDREPWTAFGSAECIEVGGEDLIVHAADGVAIWDNSERAWSEVDHWRIGRLVERVYDRGNLAAAEKLVSWFNVHHKDHVSVADFVDLN